MRVTRRGFLLAAASAPLAPALARSEAAPGAAGARCLLPESRAGFEKALPGLRGAGVVILAAAGGWEPSLAREARSGRLVIFESAAGFGDRRAFEEQRAGLAEAFALRIEAPVSLWPDGARPPYVDLAWPVRARVRDFSFATPVRGGEVVGRIGGLPVAALRRTGSGGLLLLGTPIGPALWSGDAQAHAWLASVVAAFESSPYPRGGSPQGPRLVAVC